MTIYQNYNNNDNIYKHHTLTMKMLKYNIQYTTNGYNNNNNVIYNIQCIQYTMNTITMDFETIVITITYNNNNNLYNIQ